MPKKKLSASALSLFLKSPRAFYWRYIAQLETLSPSVATYDHDKIAGQIWAEYVDRFYKGISETDNSKATMSAWLEQTDGWVPEKARERLTKAFESWMPAYYEMFSPDDGCRTPEQSELWLEDDKFVARLDGLSDAKIVHEVKSTSRSPNLSDQLWKVQNSIQVKLYCVLAKAEGHCIEFAFKDPPHQLYRGPVVYVTDEQRKGWKQELHTLADKIYSLGEDIHNYPCHPDGCCLVTKNYSSMCQFQALCDMGYNDVTQIAYTKRK